MLFRSLLIGGFILFSILASGQADVDLRTLRLLHQEGEFERILSLTGKDPRKVGGEKAFWMGKAFKRKGAYAKASACFEVASKSSYGELARSERKACQKAREWKKDPVCVVEPMKVINTDHDESCPAWGDVTYTTLLFTRTNGEEGGRNEDLMVTDKRDHGRWKKAISFQKDLNTPAHEISLTIDPRGGKGYFSRCEGGVCRTRSISRTKEGWKDNGYFDLLQPCAPDSVNHTHPAYHPGSERLYFSSDLPGGIGGYDIWYIQYDTTTGRWTDPVNAGTAVNTERDEIFPSVRKDGRLYFSSDGHAGMGGMDIFRSERDGKGGHEHVKNMGYPINSEANDTRIIFQGKLMRGFFSSDREREGTRAKDDIFRFFKKT